MKPFLIYKIMKYFNEENKDVTSFIESGKTKVVATISEAKKATEKKSYFYPVYERVKIKNENTLLLIGYAIPS
jgi:hypothetical protein